MVRYKIGPERGSLQAKVPLYGKSSLGTLTASNAHAVSMSVKSGNIAVTSQAQQTMLYYLTFEGITPKICRRTSC